MSEVLGSSLLLGLAWFAVVNVAMTILCWAVERATSRTGWSDGSWALALRLAPASVALLVLALFLPSHWRLEPNALGASDESFGLLLYLAALAGAAILARSGLRALAVARAGWRLRRCDRLPRLRPDEPVFEVRNLDGVSLVGVLRTRILVGRAVTTALSPAELDVALAHEQAHRLASDNLKRWALYCAPDLLWLTRAGAALEARWHVAAECIADERAAGGNTVRALDLASALVKVSRISTVSPTWAVSPTWSSLHDPLLLEMRVRRLVGGSLAEPARPWRLGPAAAVAVAAVMMLASNARVATIVHGVSEALIALLP